MGSRVPQAPSAVLSLDLAPHWFHLPELGSDVVEWAVGTAYAAWQLRVEQGASEEIVVPGAGEELATGLIGIVQSLAPTLEAGAQGAVWIPLPEHGHVAAVLVAQMGPRSADRAPGTFSQGVMALMDSEPGDSERLVVSAIEGSTPVGPAEGVHVIESDFQPGLGVAVVEERVTWAIFPEDREEMIEVVMFAHTVGTFEDLPAESLGVLDGLRVLAEGPIA